MFILIILSLLNLQNIHIPASENTTSSPKAVPDYATYLEFSPLGFFGTAGGAHIVAVTAKKPGGETDVNFSGTVYFHLTEENPNSSGFFFNPNTWQVVDSLVLTPADSGQYYLFVYDNDPEYIVFYATTNQPGVKPSIPYAMFVDTASANNPVIAAIHGPEFGHDSTNIMFEITLEDANGKINPNFTSIIDTNYVLVRVIDDDGTARISTFFTGDTNEAKAPFFDGRAWIWFEDTEQETVLIVTEDIDPLHDFAPDTHRIVIVPDNIATDIMPYTFRGSYTTAGEKKVLYMIAFAEDGPDQSNNTSQTMIWPIDILGTQSVSVSPSTWTTLNSGVASFNITDTEMDSFVIIRNDAQGTPVLYPSIPMFCTGYKDTSEATLLRVELLFKMAAGDTYSIDVSSIDNLENLDSTFNGWYRVDVYDHDYDGSEHVMDTLGTDDFVFEIVNGVSRFLIMDSEPESMTIQVRPYEGRDPVYYYLGTELPFGGETRIVFTPAGTQAVRWEIAPYTKFSEPGKTIFVAVNVVDSTGNVVPSWSSSPVIELTGSATYYPSPVPITKGAGVFGVTDSVEEAVVLTVYGGGLDTVTDTLYFMNPDSAAYILILDDRPEAAVNESLQINVLVLTPSMEIASYYNGWLYVFVTDTTRANTSSTYLWQDSVYINSGSGTFFISDSEPEYVDITITDPAGKLMPYRAQARFYGNMSANIYGSHIVNEEDTMDVYLLDYYGNIIDFTSELGYDSVNAYGIEYGASNGSFYFNSNSISGFTHGMARFRFSDTEAESVTIHIDPLNYDLFHGSGYVGSVVYALTGTPSIPLKLSFSVNPVNLEGIGISYQINRPGKLSMKVYDLSGRVVDKKDIFVKPGVYSENLKGLSSGVYFVKLKFGDRTEIFKTLLVR